LQFQKAIAIMAAGLTCPAGLLAANTQTKKATQLKAGAAPAPKKTTPVQRARHKPTAKTGHSTRVAHVAHKAPSPVAHSTPSKWRPGQTAPTPERYKEIQEALAKKGYLHGEASGVWNPDSADALRRFQQDQNLQASGKLDSLSIIALGLGPKY
jgi:Putative peptidoglycan binding domain